MDSWRGCAHRPRAARLEHSPLEAKMADSTTPSNVPGNVVDTESAQKQTATALVYRKPYLSNYHSNTLAIANHFRRSDFPMLPEFFKKRHWRLQQTERRTPEGETPEQNIPNLSDALFHRLKNMNSHRSDGLFNGQHRFPKSPATVSQKRKSEGSKMERPSKGKLIH